MTGMQMKEATGKKAAIRATKPMQIRKLSPNIGAEVTGVDLRHVDAETARLLNRTVLDNVCMVIRDQHLTPEEFNTVAGLFGEVIVQDHPRYSFPGLPGVKRYSNFNTNVEGQRDKTAGHWHTDGAFREVPPKFVHPLVRTIEGVGEKGLYFDPSRVEYILGMDPEASQDLLQEVLGMVIRPEFTYRHKWRLGDLLIFDNRASLHRATYEYDWNQHRLMYHAMIAGERPH